MKKKWKTLKVMITLAVVLSFLCIFTGCGNKASDLPMSSTGGIGGGSSDGSVKVDAVSPTKLTTGTEIVIKGSGFGASRAISDGATSYVTFADAEARDSLTGSSENVTATTYTDWSDDEIHCLVPTLAVGKKYVVVVHKISTSGTSDSSTASGDGNTLSIKAPGDPTAISSIGTTNGGGNATQQGSAIVIKGVNFGTSQGTSYVMFGTVQQTAAITWNDTYIVCNVPSDSPVGSLPIYVHTDAGGNSLPVTFTVYQGGSATNYPIITSLSSTSVTSGQSITITGTGFGGTRGVRENGESFVAFRSLTSPTIGNTSIATSYTTWTDTSVIVTVPSLAAGQYDLVVFRSNGSFMANSTPSEAITVSIASQAPTITSITPSTANAGTNVTITGTNFGTAQATSYVMFGTCLLNPSACTSWSDTSIVCTVPAALSGAVGVYIHTDGGGNSNTITLTVTGGPTVTSCPSTLTPGQTCTITGTGFGSSRDSGQSTVSFIPQIAGGTILTATTYLSWSDTAITCIAPSLVTGVQYVVRVNRFTSSGTIFSSESASLANTTTGTAPTAAPAITSQNPNPASAGSSVTLIGTNFPTTGGYILVNGCFVTSTFTSTSATFLVPPDLTSNATVTLGGGAGGSTTYVLVVGAPGAVPTITAITPNPAAPGSTVTITGTNFGLYSGTVTMGASYIATGAWTGNYITCTVPSTASTGTYTITVTIDGGQTATTSLTVSAPTAPTITSISPSSADAGATISITGTNFGTVMGTGSVMFGTTSATVTSWSANSITCTVPSIAAGSYTITVTTSGGSSATASITVTSGGGGSSGKMYGLFVGINAYPTSPLNWCVNDVTGMQANLTSSAYWSGASITTLTDAQATKSAIQNAISNIASQMSANDTFFFYYSGHGSNSGGASYIVPVDNNGYTTSCISDSEMQSWLSAINSSSKKCVIFDTCYSGGFVDKGTRAKFIKLKNSNPLSLRDGFARHLQSLNNTVFLGACKGTETSAESSSLKHGIFTYWLMYGLGSGTTIGPADTNRNGKISAEEAFAKASPLTTSYYSSQHPQTQDNCIGELNIKASSAYPQPTPVLTSITPASTTAGSIIAIAGSNLGTTGGTITIGSTAATYVSWNSTSIVCTVPASISAGTYTVTVTPTGCTAATIALTVTSGGGGSGKIYALFVGINNYPTSPLNYCVNDVTGMQANLTSASNWSGASITTLTDSQATKTGIQNAIATIAGQVTADDTFFFCYSGHGSNSSGVAYIIPVDNDGYTSSCISAIELNTWVSAVNASAKKVIAFDSCYSGGFVGKGCTSKFMPLKGSVQQFTGKSFAKQMETISNLVFLAACSGSETSVESSSIQHGVFIYYLMQGLGTGATPGPAASSGSVSAMGLFNYAAAPTTTFNSNQHPQSQNNYSGNLPVKQ